MSRPKIKVIVARIFMGDRTLLGLKPVYNSEGFQRKQFI